LVMTLTGSERVCARFSRTIEVGVELTSDGDVAGAEEHAVTIITSNSKIVNREYFIRSPPKAKLWNMGELCICANLASYFTALARTTALYNLPD